MTTSDPAKDIFAALVSCQSAIEGAVKDKTNPAFKSQYADLSSVMDAARAPMAAAGLALTIGLTNVPDGVALEALLVHSSGQFIKYDPFTVMTTKRDAQGQGSAVTYGRRYLTMSILGIPAEDDDGNGAAGESPAKPAPQAPKATPVKGATAEDAAFKGKLKAVTAYLVEAKPSLTKPQADELREALHAAKTADALDAVQKSCGEYMVLNAQANAVAKSVGGTVE